MRYSDESYNLRVEIDANQFELSPEDGRRLHAGLSPLDRLVEDVPVSDLYITIFHHPRGRPEYQVKARRRQGRELNPHCRGTRINTDQAMPRDEKGTSVEAIRRTPNCPGGR